jgi:hypothetical protein
VEGEGFEPSKAEPSDLQSDPFDRSGTPPNETEYYGTFFNYRQDQIDLIDYSTKPVQLRVRWLDKRRIAP